MIKYKVIQEVDCEECCGEGWVMNAGWEAFRAADDAFQKVNGRNMNWQECQSWWYENGYDDEPKSEEETCSTCSGTGVIRTETDLKFALRELGVIA